jgi:hypothetical protein
MFNLITDTTFIIIAVTIVSLFLNWLNLHKLNTHIPMNIAFGLGFGGLGIMLIAIVIYNGTSNVPNYINTPCLYMYATGFGYAILTILGKVLEFIIGLVACICYYVIINPIVWVYKKTRPEVNTIIV